MIPEHLVTLVLVVAALLVLIRWGGVIFFIYACLHFCAGEWLEAGVAFFLACFFEVWRAEPQRCRLQASERPLDRSGRVAVMPGQGWR